ncbi:MAG TPA: protein phosphatase 2C domain-containing protein [Pyrinomonadaceae bacterium]|jgi:protein phosphatase|nr:protein phosphatase 2C domain-containing protein [Pyrinomonadaceae bacterium]
MSTPSPSNKIEVGSISDRGLSEKRPLNEDSYLADASRGIFVVADGVGGAEAGEVASQTAVDVLNDAFRHKVSDGEDVEDLMELAIQRANASIHQMAQDNPRFSMMATTVVALHLDGNRATIGHVGDSRLYRLTPDGNLHRETDDHSIVEEEVRAGRMTPEQAANHPSKNVISRALGAEDSVEADMKTIEVEDGSAFLLCTDGITRHIPDNELRELLTSDGAPAQLCEEMKRRCYQRGAEDNLTAVIVQVGTPKFERHAIEDESTISLDDTEPTLVPTPPAAVSEDNATPLTPASRVAFPAPSPVEPAAPPAVVTTTPRRGRGTLRFLLFIFFIVAVGGAFYAGIIYQRQRHVTMALANAQPNPSPQSTMAGKRAAVDADPQKWISDNVPAQLTKESITKPIDSNDPEFLYLYGRALTQTGDHRGASEAFQSAINKFRSDNQTSLSLDSEAKLADAAAALKLDKASASSPSQQTAMAEDKAIRILDETLGLKREAPPK